jgi:hypothetical protein
MNQNASAVPGPGRPAGHRAAGHRPAGRRPGWKRAGLAAAAAGIALVASGCSSNGSPKAAGTVADTYQAAVAYSQCMQSHGDPGFPDPKQGPGGAWVYQQDPQTVQYFNGPGFDAAQRACRKLQPDMALTPAEREAAIEQALTISRCMRAHGIASFPDPSTKGGGIEIELGGPGLDPSSPTFQAAAKACRMPGF